MGQYYKGDKIGTCENMYYLRLDEAQEMAALGLADDDGITFREYLEDNTTRFRFPWPNEERTGRPFVIREPFKTFELPCPIEINHDAIVIHNTHKGGGYGMNIWIPCPHSPDFNLKTSNGGAGEQFVSIVFQAIRDGKEKTIFACARCQQQQRFEDAEVEAIKKRAVEYFSVYKRESEEAYKLGGGNKGLYEYAMTVIESIK